MQVADDVKTFKYHVINIDPGSHFRSGVIFLYRSSIRKNGCRRISIFTDILDSPSFLVWWELHSLKIKGRFSHLPPNGQFVPK